MSTKTKLYYRGNLSAITEKAVVAIIGTREPTKHGLHVAATYAEYLADKGITVISGLAKGIDARAHWAAMEAPGRTAAVLAHGLHMIYPRENEALAILIYKGEGVLLSEYPRGTTPEKYRFVHRDKIVARLADAVIVIETGVKGGTMHTAAFAKAYHAPVYCHVCDEYDKHEKLQGNKLLISQGAQPIHNTFDMHYLTEYVRTNKNARIMQRLEQFEFIDDSVGILGQDLWERKG